MSSMPVPWRPVALAAAVIAASTAASMLFASQPNLLGPSSAERGGSSPVAATGLQVDADTTRRAPEFQMTGPKRTVQPVRQVIVNHVPTLARSADLNGDGRVDGGDRDLVLAAWGTANSGADLNDDGVVDGRDLGLLLGAWQP